MGLFLRQQVRDGNDMKLGLGRGGEVHCNEVVRRVDILGEGNPPFILSDTQGGLAGLQAHLGDVVALPPPV